MDKVVLRFSDGKVLKGYLKQFCPEDEVVSINDISGEQKGVNINELKAIFL